MIDMYFDRRGEPMTFLEWGKALERGDRHVGLWEHEGIRVSTVWLGIDYSFGQGAPLIFETMIFDNDGNDVGMWRYTTEVQALAGHDRAVAWVQDGMPDNIMPEWSA